MAINILLRLDIVFHGMVNIEMILGNIGDHGPMGTLTQDFQLKTRQLQDHMILWTDMFKVANQWCSNVASHIGGYFTCLKDFRN